MDYYEGSEGAVHVFLAGVVLVSSFEGGVEGRGFGGDRVKGGERPTL